MTRPSHRIGTAVAGLALTAFAFTGFVANASAATIGAQPPRTYPCLHLIGTPDPCAPVSPGHPEPVDPGCLRVDIDPRLCPYQP